MDYRILIAEDDGKLSELLCDLFLSKGDKPVAAANGLEALELAAEGDFDIALLDVMMPELDGFGVCRALRKNSSVPILFLSALSEEDDKLTGYALGADDYITKPYSLSVLYAKTEALIKRSRGCINSGALLTAGKLKLVDTSRSVTVGGEDIPLTHKEYSLLFCLMRNKNIVMSREQLIYKCWGYDYTGDARAVDTYVKRLRQKLGDGGRCIKTVVGAGYVLEDTQS